MKKSPNTFVLFPALITASVLGAHAIEAPVDDAPPPRDAAMAQGKPAPADPVRKAARNVDQGYLGVMLAEVPEPLLQHLKLPAGKGVMLQSVMPGGPADGKLHQHDVVLSIDGKPVESPEEFSRSITSRKPEDRVKFDVLQNGDRVTTEVTLGARPAPLEEPERGRAELHDGDEAVKDAGWNLNGGEMGGLAHPQALPPDAVEQMKKLLQDRVEEQLRGLMPNQQNFEELRRLPNGIHMMQGSAKSIRRISDGQGTVQIEEVDGSSTVTISDSNGKVLWSGPWDTPEDKAAVPREFMDRIEPLRQDNGNRGFQLRFFGNEGGAGAAVEFGVEAEAVEPALEEQEE